MKLWQVISLLLVVAVLSGSAVVILSATSEIVLFPVAKVTIPYHFIVADTPGIDVDSDRLRLGALSAGTTNRRSIYVEHATADAARIRIAGPGKGILYAEDPEVPLVNGTAELRFAARPGNETPLGVYEGDVIIYFIDT